MLLATKDAARILGIGVSRLQQLDQDGQIRALRDSAGRRLFRQPGIMRFQQDREQRRASGDGRKPV